MVEKFVRLIPVRKEWRELRRMGLNDLEERLLESRSTDRDVRRLPAASRENQDVHVDLEYKPPRISVYLKSNKAIVREIDIALML
jgi:hypothetical protein